MKAPLATNPEKLLVVRLGSLGDILHTVPAQQKLARQFPASQIHWLAEPPYQELLGQIPGIERVWTADTRRWRRKVGSLPGALRLIAALRREAFDVALDFQGLAKSALLARLSGARHIIGFRPQRFREPVSNLFYSRAVLGDDGSRPHAIEINLRLAASLGCGQNGASPLVKLDLPEESSRYVDEQLERLEITEPILINPGAGWETKLWPASNYARLLVRIEEQLDRRVIVTYGPGEESLVAAMREAVSPHPITTFPTDLLQLAALCRRSPLLIAGDTGPLHLAVAMGTPTVAILGPTAHWRNGPFNTRDVVIKRYLFCSNSYRRTCGQFICMDIPVEEVFSGVVRRLES